MSSAIKHYCCLCKQETNHNIESNFREVSDDEDYFWERRYMIVRCLGCDSFSFRYEYHDENDGYLDEYSQFHHKINYDVYPWGKNKVEELNDFDIPRDIRTVYNEAVECMNKGLILMASAGFRITVEEICKYEKIEGRNLEIKINKLLKKGVITKTDRDLLHTVRFIGNDALHEFVRYSEDQLLLIFEIISIILRNLYSLGEKVKEMALGPVTDFEEFIWLLDKLIKKRQNEETLTLKQLINNNPRIISDDLPQLEAQLQEAIVNREYQNLLIHAPSHENHATIYKIILN